MRISINMLARGEHERAQVRRAVFSYLMLGLGMALALVSLL